MKIVSGQLLHFLDPNTGEMSCIEGSARHFILSYASSQFFKNKSVTDWLMVDRSKLILMSGNEQIGVLDCARWADVVREV